MFKTEKDLVENITSNLLANRVVGFSFLSDKNQKIFHELKLGYGVPDVVVTHYTTPSDLRSVFLDHFDILLLDLIIRKKRIDIDTIFNITRSSKTKIKNSLLKLIKEEFVSIDSNLYKQNKPYRSVLTQTVAIEAKLYSWKKALNQAYRYKWFSEHSFVFLPEENIGPAMKNIEMFKKLEVGLASVGKNSIDVIYASSPSDPVCPTMSSFLNEYVLYQCGGISRLA
ncbi:MAG: hypothetical protein Q8P10_03255 [bacterium]|nr:hypothetical protein [bacterium]